MLVMAGILIVAGAPSSSAGPLGWIQFPGICYDYDPYDKFHLYGKYYPYRHEECRDRWLMRAHRAHKEKTHFARRARGESCIRSNIKNQRNACSG
jgi:hypothetical protein